MVAHSPISPFDERTLDKVAAQVQERLGGSKRGEWIRWLAMMALAVLAAYYTATTQIAVNKEAEQNHFNEILRRLDLVQSDIRELRGAR